MPHLPRRSLASTLRRMSTQLALGATLLSATLLGATLVGCGGAVTYDARRDEVVDFEDARADFTRKGEAYHEFDARLVAHATWYSPRFAAALASYRSETEGLTRSEQLDAVDAALEKARGEMRFFVALSTRDPYWNDLSRADSTLHVRLRAGDTWLDPLSVTRVDLDTMADRAVIFPYATPLTEGYDVVFPKPADVERVELRVTGLPARVDLVWETE